LIDFSLQPTTAYSLQPAASSQYY